MKNKRKIGQISAIIVLFVLVTGTIVSNVIKNAYSTDTYTWKLNSKITVTLKEDILMVAGTGDMPDIYDGQNCIPEWSEYCKDGNIKLVIQEGITGISSYAFFNCKGIKGNLTIPSTVTKIGESAFENCTGLTGNLTLPANLLKIGNSAFKNCTGFSGGLVIPSGTDDIESYAFYGCKGFNNHLTISDGVEMIGDYAFSGCSGFTGNLIIPDTVTIIQSYAFSGCRNFDGILSISSNVTSIETGAFSGCKSLNGNLVIPSGVVNISNNTFSGCSGFDGTITIPSGVKTIGKGAFLNCSGLTGNLVIPDSVSAIGANAFSGCKNLDGSLTLPTSLLRIENGTFSKCSKLNGSLSIPSGINSIGDFAFDGCSAFTGSLSLPDGIGMIGAYAFRNCSGLTGNLLIPGSTERIGGYAFSGCSGLSGSIKIESGVKNVGIGVFYNCQGLTGTLELPDSITKMGDDIILGTEINKVINKSSVSFKLSRNTNLTYWTDSDGKLLYSVTNNTAYKKLYSGTEQYSVMATSSQNNITVGEKINITAVAFGGTGDYRYKFIVCNKDNNKWIKLQDYSSKAECEWQTDIAGNMEIYVDVIDGAGKTSRSKAVIVTINNKELSVTAFADKTETVTGDKVNISAEGAGGKSPYTYRFIVHNKDTNAWSQLRDYSTNSTITWTAGNAGNREFFAEVKDASGKIVRSKPVSVTTYSKELAVTAYADKSETVTGDKVKISAVGTGGEVPYTYRFIVHNKDTNAWSQLRDYSTNSTITWTAGNAGNREFFAEVKDASGKIVRSKPVSVTTYSKELAVTAYADKSETVTGDKVKITAKGTGGESPYTYRFIVHNKDTDAWSQLRDYSTNSTITWTAGNAGNREFFVDIKDASGTIIRSEAINIVTR